MTCGAELLCSNVVAIVVRICNEYRCSRPIGICAEHLPAVRRRVAAEGLKLYEPPAVEHEGNLENLLRGGS